MKLKLAFAMTAAATMAHLPKTTPRGIPSFRNRNQRQRRRDERRIYCHGPKKGGAK
jgi:hypothetical protein